MGRRRVRPAHPQWWDRPEERCRVLHSTVRTYVIWYPQWGQPTALVVIKRNVQLRTPDDVWRAGHKWEHPAVKKPVKTGRGQATLEANVDDLVIRWPALAEFLASTHYEGEEPGTRQLGSLLIFAQDGMWKACLRDRQESRCLWVAARQLLELFDVLEHAVAHADSVWRDDRAGGAETARRQSKPKTS